MLEGTYKILGGNNAQITYLCSTHKKIGDLLSPPESQRQIMMHLNWFQRQMRPITSRLTTMLTTNMLGNSSGSPQRSLSMVRDTEKTSTREAEGPSQSERGATMKDRGSKTTTTLDMMEAEKKVFFEKILPPLNEKL